MKIANFIPALSVAVWVLAFAQLKQNPKAFFIIAAVLVVFSVVAALIICAKAKEKKWWNAALLPLTSNIIALGYLVILSNQLMVGLIVALLIVLNYVYWRFVYFYYNSPSRYTSFSLENLSFYVNFLSVFFLGALAFGLRSFLQFNLWLILLGVALVLGLILYQGMWVAKIDWRKHGWYGGVYLIILLEFFGVLSLLPFDHNLLGFLWSSTYYLLLVIFNDLISRRFSHKRLRLYLSLVVVGWVILLLTASWL